jgi:hypothetical protein
MLESDVSGCQLNTKAFKAPLFASANFRPKKAVTVDLKITKKHSYNIFFYDVQMSIFQRQETQCDI